MNKQSSSLLPNTRAKHSSAKISQQFFCFFFILSKNVSVNKTILTFCVQINLWSLENSVKIYISVPYYNWYICSESITQNALLPAGLRQKDQTTKRGTGAFNRDKLLQYLEKEAMDHKDREDCVPFTGERKGTRMRWDVFDISLVFDTAINITLSEMPLVKYPWGSRSWRFAALTY